MPDYRFVAEDIPSGQIKTKDLRLSGWSVTDLLCRPGNLNATIGLTDPNCTEEILAPWKTAIYLLDGQSVQWGGILTPPTLGLGASALTVNAFGWLGYWDRRRIRWADPTYPNGRTFTDTDQFTIFRTLILDAQDESVFGAGWDLGIDVTWDALSGVLRDRTEDYLTFQQKNLGEALRQLAATEDGFDFAMAYTIDTSTDRIDKTIRLHYPRKGRDTGFVFEYERSTPDRPVPPTNVLARGFADPIDFAWSGDGWGEGQDEDRLRSEYVDETLRGVYPPYDASPTFGTVSEQATLDENTAAWFNRHTPPRLIPVLRVDPDRYPLWGDWTLGDTVHYRCADGYGSSDAAGPQTNRITGWTVADSGNDHQVILADPGQEIST